MNRTLKAVGTEINFYSHVKTVTQAYLSTKSCPKYLRSETSRNKRNTKKNISLLTNYSWLNKKLRISFRRWIVTKNRRIWLETTKIRCGLQTRSLPVKVDLKMSHPLWHLNLSSIHWRACKDSRLFIFYCQWILFFFFFS